MIDTEKDNRKLVERALVIEIRTEDMLLREAKEHLAELKELLATLGVPVVDEIIVNLRSVHPKYVTGEGKAEEILELAKNIQADCLVFDFSLSPSQQRNWEKLTKIAVIDREEVILDIFASRASTKEAVIQVELARMNYILPRLKRAWTHLSRQRGGAKGTRGEGEQQIEVDKRLIRKKIAFLRRELKEIRRSRDIARKSRKRHNIPQAAIVGYTNSGKSSLLNRLTNANVLSENKLFATLDPTTKRIILPNNQPLLLTDTVGFIRKLPHTLIEAFKATLEEAANADFLINLVNMSSPHFEEDIKVVLEVLDEIGIRDKPMLTVFNKIDLVDSAVKRIQAKNIFPESLFISVKTGEGIDKLLYTLAGYIYNDNEILDIKIPPSKYEFVAIAHKKANILNTQYCEDGSVVMKLSIKKHSVKLLEEFKLA